MRIAKLEARIKRRDASIRKSAKTLKKANNAAQKLAVKDTEWHAKDEQIAALTARIAQFEQAAAVMVAAVAQSPQAASASGKKRARTSKCCAYRLYEIRLFIFQCTVLAFSA